MVRITAAGFCAIVLAGCETTTTCDSLARRNAACADAFVEVAKERTRSGMADRLETLPPESRERARARMEERFDESASAVREAVTSPQFLMDCRRDWDDPVKMPAAQRTELDRCLRMQGCREYAACFIESAKMSRR